MPVAGEAVHVSWSGRDAWVAEPGRVPSKTSEVSDDEV
jgi:hypothetical protein